MTIQEGFDFTLYIYKTDLSKRCFEVFGGSRNSVRTDRSEKRSFGVNSILSFPHTLINIKGCLAHFDKHKTRISG
jgi:hypothetical protein